jgi:hypothetical protein
LIGHIIGYVTRSETCPFKEREDLIIQIVDCGASFKHRSFRQEEEVRLVTFSITRGSKMRLHHTLKQRYTSDGIVQYIVVNLKTLMEKENISFDKLIKTVMIGPRANQTIDDVSKMLSFDKNKIVKSACPLRGFVTRIKFLRMIFRDIRIRI